MRVPIHIVSGFLGAGKTSAIRNQLAAHAGERVAVIVNDFGEAGFDAASLAAEGPFQVLNIAGACVCCTAPEGFVDALGAVLAQDPERILIEPTGLARPQDLVDTLRRCPQRAALRLGPVVVLVDPARIGAGDAEAWQAQVEAADVLVANRTDLCGAEALARFDALAAELWPPPLAVEHTSHGRLAPSLFEWPRGEAGGVPRSAGVAHRHGDSTAGHEARSWCWAPDVVFSRERLRAALAEPAGLVRFKGIFRTREGVLRLEVAGGVLHEAPSAFRRDSRADAIFAGAAAEDVGRALAAAALSSEELEQQAHQIEIARPDGRSHVVDRAALQALPGGVPDVSARVPKRKGAAARLDRLFESLGIEARGEAVVCAADGFASEPVPLRVLGQGLLLHSLAGAALEAGQGGPFRLLIPPDVPDAPPGCANVKAVTRIVLRGGD